MTPSQPKLANFGNSSKAEIPPEAISFKGLAEDKIVLYNSNDGPCNIPSLEISVQIT